MQGRFSTTPVFIRHFYVAQPYTEFQTIVCYANTPIDSLPRTLI